MAAVLFGPSEVCNQDAEFCPNGISAAKISCRDANSIGRQVGNLNPGRLEKRRMPKCILSTTNGCESTAAMVSSDYVKKRIQENAKRCSYVAMLVATA